MGDPYELDVLLSLRQRDKTDAEEALAVQLAELTRCEQAVVESRQQLSHAKQKRADACRAFDAKVGGHAIGAMRQFDDYLRGLKSQEAELQRAIEIAVDDVEAQKQIVLTAKATLVETVRELKAVETHHEQWLREQKRAAQRKQSHEMDDIAARLWREQRNHET